MTDEAVGEELSRVRQRAPRDALRSDQIQSVEQTFAVYTDHASLRTAMKSPHLFNTWHDGSRSLLSTTSSC
jgi:hypothetical protein